jgi:G:T-mismatch repair DNA endonuclease (very short patch repair protein)
VPNRLLPGVFVGSHAIAEGMITRRQLRERSYRRLVQGVYADPSLDFDHQLRCRGVALLLPPGAVIGGHSAAAWHGAPFAGRSDPVTVIRPPDVLWKGPRQVRVHQAEIPAADVEDRDAVPITNALRTAWDVAALEPLGTAVAALDAMVRTGHLRMADLTTLLEHGAGRWGVTRVRRAFPLVDPRAASAPESRVRVALVMAGLSPVPQFEVLDGAGRFVASPDLAFPEARLAIEYEGEYHFEETQIVRDDERIERLERAGWRVIRLSAIDLRDLDAVVARVRAALGIAA